MGKGSSNGERVPSASPAAADACTSGGGFSRTGWAGAASGPRGRVGSHSRAAASSAWAAWCKAGGGRELRKLGAAADKGGPGLAACGSCGCSGTGGDRGDDRGIGALPACPSACGHATALTASSVQQWAPPSLPLTPAACPQTTGPRAAAGGCAPRADTHSIQRATLPAGAPELGTASGKLPCTARPRARGASGTEARPRMEAVGSCSASSNTATWQGRQRGLVGCLTICVLCGGVVVECTRGCPACAWRWVWEAGTCVAARPEHCCGLGRQPCHPGAQRLQAVILLDSNASHTPAALSPPVPLPPPRYAPAPTQPPRQTLGCSPHRTRCCTRSRGGRGAHTDSKASAPSLPPAGPWPRCRRC
jgi:hypothetical protein